MRKKLLSFVMAFILIVTLMPVTILAADPSVAITSHTAGNLETEIYNDITAPGSSISTYSAITSLTVSGGTINNTDRRFLYSIDGSYLYRRLETVDFSGTDIDYTSGSGILGSGHFTADDPNQLPEYAFGQWSALTLIKLPDSLVSISHDTFNNCTSLEAVHLPSGLTDLDYYAFSNCSALMDFYTTSSTPPTTVHPNAFMDIADDAVLHVPDGSGSAWDAGDWDDNDGKLFQLQIENMVPITSCWPIRASDSTAEITISSNEPGSCYYAVVKDGAAAPTIDTSGAGEAFNSSNLLIVTLTGLEAGAYDFYVRAKDLLGNVSEATATEIGAYVPSAAVTGVEPSGSGVSTSGDIVITFSADMYTSDEGSVSLDGGSTALTGGSWSADERTYTIAYAGLSRGTTYIVTISGFYDAMWNLVADDSSHGFKTKSKSSSPSGETNTDTSEPKNTEEEQEQNSTAGTSFGDVSSNSWYFNPVRFVTEKGLMNGTGDGEFGPSDQMTRSMIVTVLNRLSGESGTFANTFSDIASGAWYENAAAWAAANGIINGVGESSFAPSQTLSREQLAVMLYNYAKYKGLNTAGTDSADLDGFTDSDSISIWAEDAVRWAVSVGIINGDDAYLNPKASASRAEVAAMLQRFIENVL